MFEYFSKNGAILPIKEATIPVGNIAYSYGFGVYESIKVRHALPYFVEQHIKRLLKSAEIIELSHDFSEKGIQSFLDIFIKKENTKAYNIKVLLIGGKTAKDAELFILPLAPRFPDRNYYIHGIKTITHNYERQFTNAKTLNMLGSYLAFRKASENDCYDALLLKSGYIIEGTRTNFFLMKDKTIFTQPDELILEGVTRETVLHVAKKEGFEIKKEIIALDAIANFDGAFLTSTSSNILPIKQIDNHIFPTIPDALRSLMKTYDDFLENSNGVFAP